jgi:hypothetical protein
MTESPQSPAGDPDGVEITSSEPVTVVPDPVATDQEPAEAEVQDRTPDSDASDGDDEEA